MPRSALALLTAALLAGGASTAAQAYDIVDKPLEGRAFDHLTVKLGGFVQPRFRFEPADPDVGTAGQIGFSVQRARLELEGVLTSPSQRPFPFSIAQKYSLELGGQNGAILQDAYIDLGFGTEFHFRVGQFKAPIHRANLVSDANNLFPDRNRITQFAGLPDRDIGVMFHGYWGRRFIEYSAGVWNGEGANRISANKTFLYAGRVVFSPWGSPGSGWEILKDWRWEGDEVWRPVVSVGYSVHYEIDGVEGERQSFLGHNVEGFLHWRFLTVMSEFFYRTSYWEVEELADFQQQGWYVQLGAFWYGVPWAQDHLALLGRVEQGDEFRPLDPDLVDKLPPSGPLDPAQATRRYTVGLGVYANQPLFKYAQDLRLVVSYTIKTELEGLDVKNDELNVSANLTF